MNYIIFILLFLVITIGNMLMVKLLKNSVLVSGDIPVTRPSEQGPGY